MCMLDDCPPDHSHIFNGDEAIIVPAPSHSTLSHH